MSENDRSFMNRRDLTLGAMAGGASLLFSTAASAQQDSPANRSFVDVTKVGAVGDGKTDSTAARNVPSMPPRKQAAQCLCPQEST